MAELEYQAAGTGEGGGDPNEPALQSVTDQEREIGNWAGIEFEKKQYDGCAKLLDKLFQSRNSDPQVLHNKFVLDYYQSGMRQTEDFAINLRRVCDMAGVKFDDVESVDDVDQCIIYYNQAIILYHTKKYGKAIPIVEKLFTLLEPLDEILSRRVMAFLAELYFCTSQPERALTIISSLEKSILSKKESEQQSGSTTDDDVDEWKAKIVLYKVQGLLASRSLKQCKRELKNLASSNNDLASAYMKANFDFTRGNLQKAMRILNSVQPTNTPRRLTDASAAMYYNNLACIHMLMKKHNLGAFYFKKALTENEMMAKDLKLETLNHSINGKPLHSLPVSRHYELLYNTGIQLLHCGKPSAAFDCLIEAVKVYSSNPRLWLRLAECCVMSHRKSNDDDRNLDRRMQVIHGIIGTGLNRKLVLGNGKGDFRPGTESAAMPGLTLEFGNLCLNNALLLLDKGEQKARAEQTNPGNDKLLVPAPPSTPMKYDEVAQLRCSILANSAYISLLLNDYILALNYSQRLLTCDRLTPALKYLGHMYLAEAEVYLDRIADAIRNLDLSYAADVSATLPNSEQEKDESNEIQGSLYPWIPENSTRAEAYMHYNLAVCYAMRTEFDKAMVSLSKCTTTIGAPLPVHVYFLRLYLDLIEGRRAFAQAIIKEHFGHATPNARVAS